MVGIDTMHFENISNEVFGKELFILDYSTVENAKDDFDINEIVT